MATYVITGRNKTGKSVRQKVDAASPSEARNLIKEQGIHIQDIQENKGIGFNMADIQTSMTSVTVKDKAVFLVNLQL